MDKNTIALILLIVGLSIFAIVAILEAFFAYRASNAKAAAEIMEKATDAETRKQLKRIADALEKETEDI